MAFFMFSMIVNIIAVWTTNASSLVQYGFAHRVNSGDQIKNVLNNGANGIEIDICFDDNENEWYVSHDDVNCKCPSCEKLSDWLQVLSSYLNENADKKDQLAMLWLDIKTPEHKIKELLDIVHRHVSDVNILYDLVNFNDEGKSSFHYISNRLNDNEGISFFASSKGEVDEIYNFYKSNSFTRGTINHGHSFDANDGILNHAHSSKFRNPDDPFRFKLVLTWTNNKESTMRKFMAPGETYTDGQIYGGVTNEWSDGDEEYIYQFNGVLSEFSGIMRRATAKDDPFNLPTPTWNAFVWIGTAPFCGGSREDCFNLGHGWEAIMYSTIIGEDCASGTKVLCARRADSTIYIETRWIGTAPTCSTSCADCYDLGKGWECTGTQATDPEGGNACWTGKKTLCGFKGCEGYRETRWYGTAPWCSSSCHDCSVIGWRCIKQDKVGDGSKCWSGTKTLCGNPC